MTEKKLKVGDKVRVLRRRPFTPESAVGKTFTIMRIGGSPEYGLNVPDAFGAHNLWWYDADDLELVRDRPKVARILTEKVTIGNVPCFRILGFEGILSYDELPEKYNKGLLEFNFDKDEKSSHRFVFDGKDINLHHSELSCGVLHFHVPDAEPKIESYCFLLTYMNIGDILPEKTFQQILVWLKRAGSRLAKIRKQEKAAWSGKEAFEI